MKVLNWGENTIIRLQLWDIAGEWNHDEIFKKCLNLKMLLFHSMIDLHSFWRQNTTFQKAMMLPENVFGTNQGNSSKQKKMFPKISNWKLVRESHFGECLLFTFFSCIFHYVLLWTFAQTKMTVKCFYCICFYSLGQERSRHLNRVCWSQNFHVYFICNFVCHLTYFRDPLLSNKKYIWIETVLIWQAFHHGKIFYQMYLLLYLLKELRPKIVMNKFWSWVRKHGDLS